MVLVFVDAYIVLIFFKTVFLVISFSMIHGLIFLPIVLMVVIPQTRYKKDPMKVTFTCTSLNKVADTNKVPAVEFSEPVVYSEQEGHKPDQDAFPASESIVQKVITPESQS